MPELPSNDFTDLLQIHVDNDPFDLPIGIDFLEDPDIILEL